MTPTLLPARRALGAVLAVALAALAPGPRASAEPASAETASAEPAPAEPAPAEPAPAGLRLGTPFSDHMVVQADRPVVVWGSDAPGTAVTVRVGGGEATATAGGDGRWRAELPPVPAGPGPIEFAAEGTSAVALRDVAAGDVWWCSGQSNMQFELRRSADAGSELGRPADPNVRLLTVPQRSAPEPIADVGAVGAAWEVAGPDTVGDFSAVAYHFGRRVAAETGRPVGLVDASWGGSNIAAWLPADVLGASPHHPALRALADGKIAAYDEALAAWQRAGRAGKRPPNNGGGPQHRPSHLYNGMTHPAGPMAVRGVLWYQGEADSWQPDAYADLLADLVGSWRAQFGDPALPVYLAQLPNFDNGRPRAWADFREAQRRFAAGRDGVGMAVTIDVGESGDIHPRRKRPVGERLALLALRGAYGLDVAADSPQPASAAVVADGPDAGAVRVNFDHAGAGLRTTDGRPPAAFALVGADGERRPAGATIDGPSSVVLRADGGGRPASVEYAYEADPAVNLVNAAGLPASPFAADVAPADPRRAPTPGRSD